MDESPGDEALIARIAEVESMAEEEVETLARDLAESGDHQHEVETPFAWSDDAAEAGPGDEADAPKMGAFFSRILGDLGEDA